MEWNLLFNELLAKRDELRSDLSCSGDPLYLAKADAAHTHTPANILKMILNMDVMWKGNKDSPFSLSLSRRTNTFHPPQNSKSTRAPV